MTEISVDASEPIEQSVTLHHLPVQIQHTGAAKVSAFFMPEQTTETFEGKPVHKAAFRGRRLCGLEVTVPEGYSGVIFREDDPHSTSPRRYNEDEEEQNDNTDRSGPARTWAIQSRFNQFFYWTRQLQPTNQDKELKWMEWTKIASHIHARVTPEQMAAPARRSRSEPSEKTGAQVVVTQPDTEDDTGNKGKKRKAPEPNAEQEAEPALKRQRTEDTAPENEEEEDVTPTAGRSSPKKHQRRHSMPGPSSPKKN